MTRVLGLIGGMSWKTTEVYYREINQRINSRLGGIRSAELLIKSLDYSEVARCITAKDFDSLSELLCRSARQLQAAGAEAVILCANVVHKVVGDIENRVGLPVLHIADFTAKEVVRNGHSRVGLLATRAVMEQDFYKARLRDNYGLEVFVPPKSFREDVDKIIFDELSKESIPPEAVTKVRSAYKDLVDSHNVDSVILGCTEFRLVFRPEDMTVPTFDTTALHAKGVADWALDTDTSR